MGELSCNGNTWNTRDPEKKNQVREKKSKLIIL